LPPALDRADDREARRDPSVGEPTWLADIAVVGAGAAGLMAAIQAARAAPSLSVVAVDGARRLGAKILVSGGGRCNVTHHEVSEKDFCGGSPKAIAQVLRAFGVEETIAFFRELGVDLKREETGKLFPTTDRARSVLDALLEAARRAGVRLVHPFRVERIERVADRFRLEGPQGRGEARRVVLATGGRSLPKSGSDGHGYALARGLGHTITPLVLPALVPLLLPEGHPLRALSGVSTPATLEVRSGSGKRLARVDGDLLLTHFGLSGPVVLDVSRHLLVARASDAEASLRVRWVDEEDPVRVEAWLAAPGAGTVADRLAARLPHRLAALLLSLAGVPEGARPATLRREERRALRLLLTEMALPVTGPRSWESAEVTAGGVPLAEVRLGTMASRVCEGLHLCGEILDVDGRIGGFNFQWAWASGTAAGRGAAKALVPGLP